MSAVEQTLKEALNSVTGYDEVAVLRHFDIDLYVGNDEHPMRVPRALIFVLKRREGMSDVDSKEFAMNLGLGDVNDYFADEPEDIDPDEPDSDAGKESGGQN